MNLVAPLALLFAASGTASAGDSLEPWSKLAQSPLVIELRVPLTGAIPADWPNQGYDPAGWAFPDTVKDAGLQAATVERILVGGGGVGSLPVPEHPYLFGGGSACWWLAHQRGGLRTLLFLGRGGPSGWQQVYGVEQEWGAYSDLNPRYEDLVQAFVRAGGWRDERTQAVAPEALWQDQRAALASDNPFLLVLARDFLRAHDAGWVLDEVWGTPGLPERAAREAAATWPEDHGYCAAALRGE